MKLYGIAGKGTGRVGSQVFAISGGEQIVRQYNPVVSNPSTEGQVQQRAKMKLMTQLAAAFAPALGFKKKGLVSARNQFVSANIRKCNYDTGTADINLLDIDLTGGNAGLPTIEATMGENGVVSAAMATSAQGYADRLVYVAAIVDESDKVVITDVKIVETAGAGNTFPTTLQTGADSAFIYAYGVKFNGSSEAANYGSYEANYNDHDATLASTLRQLLNAGTITMTKVVSVTA